MRTRKDTRVLGDWFRTGSDQESTEERLQRWWRGIQRNVSVSNARKRYESSDWPRSGYQLLLQRNLCRIIPRLGQRGLRSYTARSGRSTQVFSGRCTNVHFVALGLRFRSRALCGRGGKQGTNRKRGWSQHHQPNPNSACKKTCHRTFTQT